MSQMILTLPPQLNGTALCRVAQDFAARCNGILPQCVAIDFANLRFIRPSGVTFLSNFIQWLANKDVSFEFINIHEYGDPIRFLDDASFFEIHNGEKLRTTSNGRDTTFPIRILSNEQSIPLINGDIIPWIMHRTGLNRASLHTFQVCLREIFNNIADHSSLDIGSIFAQHFPKENTVTIAIADFGKGIPSSVRSRLLFLSDAEAIVKAVEDGFTSKSTPRNRGAGLDPVFHRTASGQGRHRWRRIPVADA